MKIDQQCKGCQDLRLGLEGAWPYNSYTPPAGVHILPCTCMSVGWHCRLFHRAACLSMLLGPTSPQDPLLTTAAPKLFS